MGHHKFLSFLDYFCGKTLMCCMYHLYYRCLDNCIDKPINCKNKHFWVIWEAFIFVEAVRTDSSRRISFHICSRKTDKSRVQLLLGLPIKDSCLTFNVPLFVIGTVRYNWFSIVSALMMMNERTSIPEM